MEIKDMSNSELKLEMEKLYNHFENKKTELSNICEEMDNIEKKYLSIKKELEMRKNIYL
jgi:hypothetical protein